MIRASSARIIRKVLLNNASAKRYRAQDGCMTGRMIAQTENQIRVDFAVAAQYIQVDVTEILQTRGVVCIALEQRKLAADRQCNLYCAAHIIHCGGAGSQDKRLALSSHMLDQINPRNIAGADLVR